MKLFGKDKTGDPQGSVKPSGADDYQQAADWESCRLADALRSETNAWKVAGCAVAVAVLLAVAVIVLVPLKESVPYVVKVDSAGAVDIITTLKDKPMSYDDILDKYWLAKYVRAYESWDFYTAQDDYEFIGLTSSPEVSKQYAGLFTGPKAIDEMYGEQNIVRTKIISVVPTGNGIATVRFEKAVRNRNSQSDVPGITSKWVATIGYDYKKIAKMKESERLKNPLGFNVQSYRIDAEMLDVPAVPKAAVSSSSQPVVPAINATLGGSK
jgi:type IV secretion system protein VirB8